MSGSSCSSRDLPPGVHGCSGKCECCSYMKKKNKFQSRSGNVYRIRQSLNCKTSNVIYIIECKRCLFQFVEQTAGMLREEFYLHKVSIVINDNQPISQHFNNDGHSFHDLTIFPIEQIIDPKNRRERELYWIKELKIMDQISNAASCLYGRPQARDLDEYENSMHSVINLVDDDPEEGTSCHPQTQSAAVTPKRKQPGGDPKTPMTPKRKQPGSNPKTPNKKRKMEEKRQCETEQRLHVCECAVSDAKKVMSVILEKLQNVSCRTTKSKEYLENLKEKIVDLQAQNPFQKIYVGLFGRTGAGKSSLINAILNQNIVPSGSIQACTSVCVQVEANPNDNKYRAEIEFISREDWESELQFLLKELSKGKKDEDDAFLKIAKEKFEALYGEEGFDKDYKHLMGNKKIAATDTGKKNLSVASAEDLYKKISCYIQNSRSKVDAYWPLVKCVTIYVPDCPALPEGVVLVDLPGAGDANKQRDEMWKEFINKCASVWIVNEINRALSDKEGDSIFESSLRTIRGGGECHNITFICTKTEEIDVEETKSYYNITEHDLELHKNKNSSDYEEREECACILYRNAKIKEDFERKYKDKTMDMLIGEHDASDSYFSVFTVSSKQYGKIQKGKFTTLQSQETEIPLLVEHIKKLYMSHCEKKAKDYLTQVSAVISFLRFSKHLCTAKLKNFAFKERERLEAELSKNCDIMGRFLSDVQKSLDTSLDKGVCEAQKYRSENAKKILEPVGTDFRGYHRTLKAMCKNNGYFRSSTGDIIDLNYTLSEPIYAKMNRGNMFVKIFSSKGLRSSISGKLQSFNETFIDASLLNYLSKRSKEKYLCLIYIKTEQKTLLNALEQEILQRKKQIYNSVSLSVQETLKPVYTVYGTDEKYTLKGIQEKIKNKIESSKNEMFRQAKDEMIRLFDDLRTWIVDELKRNMTKTMMVALGRIPQDLNIPDDFSKEFEIIEKSCKSLKLKIIA